VMPRGVHYTSSTLIMKTIKTLTVSVLLCLTSCAGGPVVGKIGIEQDGGPSQTLVAQAQFGDKPDLAMAQQKATENFFRVHRMKDPTPLFKWGADLEKGWVRSGSEYRFGWLLSGAVAGRNSYGGYNGYQGFWTVFNGYEVVAGTKIYEGSGGQGFAIGYYYAGDGSMVVSGGDEFRAGMAAGASR